MMRKSLVAAVGAAFAVLAGTVSSAYAALPPLGAPVGSVDWSKVDGAVPYKQGHAIPLKAARPAWFSRALERRVDAANGVPVAAPNDAPLPGTLGIRPGSWMLAPSGCTMNFVFGSAGSYSIGTAGHCGKAGEQVTLLTLAPGGSNPVLVDIGTIQRSVDGGVGNDFAIASIRPELQTWVSPTIAVVAGPCGSYGGAGPEPVFHYGHGVAVGTGGTPRAGVALTWESNAFGWSGLAAPGDSGSAVRVNTGMQAAGDLTHLVVDTDWLPSYIAGTRMGRILQIAGQPLANSPLC
ncbi:MAG: hypothetical protein ACRDM7_12890 [Thermoleophilaceae bacterium]